MTSPNTPTQSQVGTSSTGGNLGNTPPAPGGVVSPPVPLNNQRPQASFPTLNPPPMQTLVYAPKVDILIGHNGIQYDISKDIVRGWVARKENSASSLRVTLGNQGLRYNQQFSRMDRLTCYLTRTQKIQVFSGYLDSVPFFQAYPGTIDIEATCTIKRLLHTWWNPALPNSQAFFDQMNSAFGTNGDGQGGAATDSGIGSILRNILQTVGGWTPQSLHIQNFPQEFITFLNNYMSESNLSQHWQTQANSFNMLLLGDDTSPGPMGAVGYQAGDPVGTAASATNSTAQFYLAQFIAAVDQRGMGPLVASTANSSQLQNTANVLESAASSGGMTPSGQALAQDVKTAGQSLGQYASNWSTQNQQSDAAILAYACAMVESGGNTPVLLMLANNADPPTLSFFHDGLSTNGSSAGLFQQQNNGAWGCLPAEAQIFTSHGPIPIVDVKEGDEVWSFDGERISLDKVTAWMMTGNQTLVAVKTAGRELRATSGHRVPIRRYMGLSEGRQAGSCGWENIEVGAGDIRTGDYLIVPHGMGDGDVRTLDNSPISESLMELFGLYLGDGNLDQTRVEISHGTSGIYNDHIPYYKDLITQELGVTPYSDKRGTRTRFSSPSFVNLIQKHFPGKASAKRLPGWVFRIAPELQLALLRGYLDADGSVDKMGRVSYDSVSRGLIEDVRHLCILLGLPVGRVGVRHDGGGYGGGKILYSLRLSSTHHNPRIGSHSPHKASRFRTDPKKSKSRYDENWNSSVCRRAPIGTPPEGAVYHRVISVSTLDEEVPVYDLEVNGMKHYVADGVVVHNTPAQRMNPLSSCGMFLDALNSKTGWRNMDPGQAIWQVQQSDPASITKYSAAYQVALPIVQAYRKTQQGASNAANSAINQIPGAGSLNNVLGGGTNALGSIAGNVAGAATTSPVSTAAGALQTGAPNPNSEGAINAALSMVGTPYVFGGTNPASGIDCSRMVELAFLAGTGIDVSRSTDSQRSHVPSIPPASAQRGDILQTNGGGHTGIYLGGGMWIQTGGGNSGNLPMPGPQPINPATAYWAGRVCSNGGANVAAPFTPVTGVTGGGAPGVGTGTPIGAGTGGVGGGTGGSGGSEPIARNLFSYMFNPGAYATAYADFLTGEKAYIDDQPLIQIVRALASASLRNFQSAPNGDLIFYYPDQFGLDGKPSVLALEDIELKDCSLQLSDNNLTTHVYIEGDYTMIGEADSASGWLTTSGVATVENTWLYHRLANVAPGDADVSTLTAQQLMNKFGVRPYKDSYQIAGNAGLEFLLACQIFMGKWASQYETNIGLTFMPELYPGMRITLVGHNMQVYCSSVTHEFDYQRGFSTMATVSAPSNPQAASSIYSSLSGFINPISTTPGSNTTNTGQSLLPSFASAIGGSLLDGVGHFIGADGQLIPTSV